MKSIAFLLLSATLMFASEFISIQPDNLIADYKAKGTVLIYDQEIPLKKNSKNPNPLGSVNFSQDDWYVSEGWNEYKAYYPPGTGMSNIQFIAKTNASFRIHLAFKADEAGTVNHVNPIQGTTYLDSKNTTEFLATNGKNITIDNDLINNNNGGWLYIFMVEDAANVESYYGDVNPNILLTTATIITDTVKYNQWLNSVDLLSSGSPGDAVGVLNITEKISPTSSSTRQVVMDLAIDPNLDKDTDGVSPAQGDCNDYDKFVYPGATEIANDGVDQDCNGVDKIDLTILDQDNDGYTPASGDCNDFNNQINPSKTPIPNNGINDNCAQPAVYEYGSLHPEDLLTDLVNKLSTSDNVTIAKNISVTRALVLEGSDWFAPNGWQSYKFFIPKGVDSARIVASSSTPNADFRVHAAFKANHNQTITHVNPVQITNPIATKDTVEASSTYGNVIFIYDTTLVNSENGGYVYLDIANNPSAPSADVALELNLHMQDHSIFDAWKYNVNVIFDDLPEDGNPEDSVPAMTVIDKISQNRVSKSRIVPMQRALTSWSEYTNTILTSSSSSISSSVSSTGLDCRAYVNWNNPECTTSTGGGTVSSTVTNYSSSTASTGLDCRAYVNWNNPLCTGATTSNTVSSSSTPSYSSSSVSSTSTTGDIDCRAYVNWSNPQCTDKSDTEEEEVDTSVEIITDNAIIKENLSGREITIAGVFTQYDFNNDGTMDPFDWVYKDSYGYAQLRGNAATSTNVFGWKDIEINETLVANWYLFPIGSDLDADGSEMFDWIIVSADSNNKQVYKLSGVTSAGTFRYSEFIDINYDFSDNRESVIFADLRPGERTN